MVFFTLLLLSRLYNLLESKSRAYHDPDYESRIQASLTGVNET